ncbi:SNF2 family N-terminal domain-containing protein [Pilobolus umbonatus]|nr:SNF2 family N-terminal domain-containing protein [Pilobolus umbonatus]
MLNQANVSSSLHYTQTIPDISTEDEGIIAIQSMTALDIGNDSSSSVQSDSPSFSEAIMIEKYGLHDKYKRQQEQQQLERQQYLALAQTRFQQQVLQQQRLQELLRQQKEQDSLHQQQQNILFHQKEKMLLHQALLNQRQQPPLQQKQVNQIQHQIHQRQSQSQEQEQRPPHLSNDQNIHSNTHPQPTQSNTHTQPTNFNTQPTQSSTQPIHSNTHSQPLSTTHAHPAHSHTPESRGVENVAGEEMKKTHLCIGMVTTDIVTVHALDIVKEDKYEIVRLESEGRRNTDNYSFTVSSRGVPSKFYGWVPFDITRVLGPLIDDYLIWWDAVIPRGKTNVTRTPIYIILYCRSDYYPVVSNHFTHYRLYLKEPPFHNPHCSYSNPHQHHIDRYGHLGEYTPRGYHSSSMDMSRQAKFDIEQLLESIPNDIPKIKRKKNRKKPKNEIKNKKRRQLIESDEETQGDMSDVPVGEDQDGVVIIPSDSEEEEEDGFIDGLTISLMPHQVQGVNWMIDRENNESSSGGILADVSAYMGLGKTIQTIGLMVSTMSATNSEDENEDTSRSSDDHRITLIVTPLALIHQWADEIRTKTEKGRLRVLIHHGPNRTKNASVFRRYDVVITTYQVVASDMPCRTGKNKGKSNNDAIEEDSTVGTSDSPILLDDKEVKNKPPNKDHGPLFKVKWYRIVLDEAQQIKNKDTQSSLSCSGLSAVKRWCLTGTPIQNNVDELYSLLRFLQIVPLCNYSSFKKTISVPIQQGNPKLAMGRLKAVFMAIMLRRTKAILNAAQSNELNVNNDDGSSTHSEPSQDKESNKTTKKLSIKLPTREKEDIYLTFSYYERSLYDLLKKKAKDSVDVMMESDKKQNAYLNMLCHLLRLRQACDHPQLVLNHIGEDKDALDLLEDSKDVVWEEDSQGMSICRVCRKTSLMAPGDQENLQALCDECLSKVDQSVTDNPNGNSSTKVNKLMEILENTRRSKPGEKTIVFSQFTSMLDLLEGPLRENKFRFCRYDGSMSPQLRERSLTSLRYDPKCTVMLISLKCGSLGLNLTAANRVVLMDIWWNPALEEQAIDRVHRIGQKLPVYVTRLMIDQTVEQNIVALQDKKALLTKGALGDGMVKNTKLTSSEIRSLFFS